MDFRTASKTALLVLPPSHAAGIVPFATAPQIVIVYYLAGGAASDSRMAAEKAGIWPYSDQRGNPACREFFVARFGAPSRENSTVP